MLKPHTLQVKSDAYELRLAVAYMMMKLYLQLEASRIRDTNSDSKRNNIYNKLCLTLGTRVATKAFEGNILMFSCRSKRMFTRL